MNMCSVRQSPMPCAPSSRAFAASSGVSAFAQTSMRRSSSAHDKKVANQSGSFDGGRISRELADGDVAGRAVDRDPIAFVQLLAVETRPLIAAVDLKRIAPGNARLAHAARDDGRVRRRAAFGGENAFRRDHAVHVVGSGLRTHENGLAPLLFPRHRIFRRENDLAGRRSRRGVESLARSADRLTWIDPRVKELIERVRVDHSDGAPLVDESFVHEIERDFDRRLGAALCAARLQHEELSPLDRELEILHVAIMPLEPGRNLRELLVHLRLPSGEIGNLLGRSDPGDDVFALRVVEILAEERSFAGVGIARERHAGSGVVAHVPEDHLHHVDGGAPIVGNLVEPTVVDGAL